ncbi:MAG: beta-ketoacyl-[acyl-carrier-protein] synthase family protein [Elusimicrobiota bacterium]|jgi:3-oxoacyl-[acyl-carrier-protein] synthase II|nr:beta-ketoacyl-[acyl-carrier-protein] synthase family protein [Elusimicrobiota bacterium]
MQKKRVVITGMGAVSPYGFDAKNTQGVDILVDNMLLGKTSIAFDGELSQIPDITSRVSSKVPAIDFSYIPRQLRRSMSKMSLYAAGAVRETLTSAGFEKAPQGTALFLGSTISSMETWVNFAGKYQSKEIDNIKTNVVFQVMNHSPLANVSQAFDLKGIGIGASAACATGLMNTGLAYLALSAGFADYALCGGTDEYHPIMTCCFSIMNAASNAFNENPEKASRPFDKERCGIVCGEGCGMLFLESLDNALKRKVKIFGEIAGFASNTDSRSIAHPSSESISDCMRKALQSADGLKPQDIDLINAHATSTIAGDIEEAKSISEIFGENVLVNSLKGHIGHTMAASGSLELIAILKMAERGHFAPTLNLENIDEACLGVNLFKEIQNKKIKTFMKNSFALGGQNCSLIVKLFES